jgi:transcription elongation factor Elf1
MTSETRTFIESEDILGVEFECLYCHTRALYEVKVAPKMLLSACPNCNQRFSDSPNFDSDARHFFSILTAMSHLVSDSKAKIRIQVKGPEDENEK